MAALGWDAIDFLCTRRSVRRFLLQEVPPEVLERVLTAATWAPSAHNRQPWRFLVVKSQAAKERLAGEMSADFRGDLLADGLAVEAVEAQVARSSARLLSAPTAIVLCLDESCGDDYPDETRRRAERLMGVQSVALAGGQLLLAAHAVGLSGVWMCAPLFAPLAVRRALAPPETWQPQALILLGYARRIPEPRARRPIGEVMLER